MRKTIPIEPLPPAMPKCFDNLPNWLEWTRLNKLAGPVDRAGSLEHFCADCLPDYQKRMHAQERCAYPNEATRPAKVNHGT